MEKKNSDIDFLKQKAKCIITKKVEYHAQLMGVKYGRITIRCQKSRWGSCSTKGNLNFNCLLMLTPDYVQNYVVVHELAHIKEMNHSQKFWSVVEDALPDYKTARKWLRVHGAEVIKNRIAKMN